MNNTPLLEVTDIQTTPYKKKDRCCLLTSLVLTNLVSLGLGFCASYQLYYKDDSCVCTGSLSL